MDWDIFKQRIDEKKFNEIEKELNKSIGILDNKNEIKYQLGICYSYQQEKKQKTIQIFNELIQTDFSHPYLYIYLSKETNNFVEKEKIIKCGLDIYPDNETLNNYLIEISNDLSEIEKSYKILKSKKAVTNFSNLKMAEMFYDDSDYSNCIKFLQKINLCHQNPYTKDDLRFLMAICNYYIERTIGIRTIKKYATNVYKNRYGYLPYLLEIMYYINNNNMEKVSDLVKVFPYSLVIDNIIYIFTNDGNSPCAFPLDGLIKELINTIFKNKKMKKYENQVKVIEIFYKINNSYSEKRLAKKDLKNFINIFEVEISNNNSNHDLNKMYFDLLMKNNNYNKAFNFFKQNCINNCFEEELWNLRYYNFNDIAIKELYKITTEVLETSPYISKKELELFNTTILMLYNNKKYNLICELYEIKNDFSYLENDNLFNVAYSYYELKNDDMAEILYLELLKKEENNSAVMNNLGLIYENKKELDRALYYFEESEKVEHDSIHTRNIDRCKGLLYKAKKYNEEKYEGIENIKNDNIFIIDRFKKFAAIKNKNNDVICSYAKLPSILETTQDKAKEILNHMILKKYIYKLKEHEYETSTSVYKINDKVEEEIVNIEKASETINLLLKQFDKLKINYLQSLKISERLTRLEIIGDKEMRDIILRDYHELIQAYILNNKKTIVLLSGTISELLLIYIIEKSNKVSNTNYYNYSINELLNLCETYSLLSNTPAYLIRGIKKFRNFIHPGVEIREKSKRLIIDDNSAQLLWDFVNWLIDFIL